MAKTYTQDAISLVGEQIRVHGWVDSIRDHGKVIFIDLRDSKGILQIVVDTEINAAAFAEARQLGNEYVIAVHGSVRQRSAELVNEKIPTGKIELVADQIELLNKSLTLPFPIDTDGHEINEETRLKYRYLDLRRPRMQKILKKRAELLLAVRNWMTEEGFLEVTTPLLTSSSPEGARDYIIPSRLYPGKFFVLPQAPQQYKQLLMVAGVDRYFQIAPCARDEDPRADRHAGEFYQIDIEISFPTIDEIFDVAERLIEATYPKVAPEKKLAAFPFPRIPHAEAIARYGSDKPDLRFGIELQDVTEIVKGKTEFNVFNNAELIKCVVAPGCGEWSRTEIEAMESYAKQLGAKGLAYAKVTESGLDTGIAKFMEPVAAELISHIGAQAGDLIFFAADKPSLVHKVLGGVRSKLGDSLGLKDPNILSFAWITDFPFYELDEKTGKLDFAHNPFSMPKGGMAAFDTEEPLNIESYQYDLAVNGYEAMSGSIRNHDPEVLVKAFEVLGYGREEVIRRFGALYNAFQYGAPPHGGWAIGIDRLFMVLSDEPNIRDIYAFPKSSSGMDLMMSAPSELAEADLKLLGIELTAEVKAKLKGEGSE